MLMSSPGGLACDSCVPRGCSCNDELKEGIDWESDAAKDPKNYTQPTDDKGRQLPCCEWLYFENGVPNGNLDFGEYLEAAGYEKVGSNEQEDIVQQETDK